MIERSFVSGDPNIRIPNPPQAPQAPQAPPPLPTLQSGYVLAFHIGPFVDALARLGLTARMVPMIGQHLVAGAALAWVWKNTDDSESPHVPARDFADFVDLALGQVRRYDANEPRVVSGLCCVCAATLWFGGAAHRAVVRQYVETLLSDVSRLVTQTADREQLIAEGTAVLKAFDESGASDGF